jgi:Ca-activated chloride channel family protein
VLTFRLKNREETLSVQQLSVTRYGGSRPALKALFGARRLQGLEYLMVAGLQGDVLREQLGRLGYDPKEITVDQEKTVYAENARRANREALKSLLVRESLGYGLACSETAFVAVRKEAGERVESHVVVGNALPEGWSEDFLSAPRAAPMGAPASLPMDMSRSASGLGATLAKALGAPRRAMRSAPIARATSSEGGSQQYLSVAAAGGRKDEAIREASSARVFSGVPIFAEGRALLFDSSQEAFPDETTISRLAVQLKPMPDSVDGDLTLLLFIGDMAVPRARIRLSRIVRLGGERPLNLHKRSDETVRIVLVDPNGKWPSEGTEISVTLTM